MFKATLIGGAGLLAVAQVATAQDSAAPEADMNRIEEVLVTAERRSENVQNVPVAISVVTPSQLEKAGVRNIFDISSVVSGLTITNTNGYVNASVRGVGSNGVGPGTENQVAIYIDDVYSGGQAGSKLSFINIDQVAVLKGPQGTLFGRNATGGVVQVTTREPSDTFTGEGTVSVGRYMNTNAAGYLSGPLSDTLKADIAFTATHQEDGWGINRFNGEEISTIDHDVAVRSKWVATPAEGTKLTLIGDYSSIKATTVSSQMVLPGSISGWVPANGVTPDIGYDTNQDGPNNHEGFSWGGSLKWEQDLGAARFVSISAYKRDTYTFEFDYDYGPEDIENIWVTQPRKQFTQEFQLQSLPEDRLKWVTGLYYYYAKAGHDPFHLVGNDIGLDLIIYNFQVAKSYAGFAQATYDIFQDTNLTVGVRYTDEKREVVDGEMRLALIPGPIPLPDTFYPDQSTSDGQVTYRVSLDHRFSEQLLTYVSFNTGFKSGGYNAGAPGTAPYAPETLEAWEVGIKADLFDRRVRFNAAGYYYDYTDIQVQQLNQGATTVVNGASATIYGIDADLAAVIGSRLTLSSGFNWSRPTFDSYPNCLYVPPSGGVPGVVSSCAGNLIPLAPKFTMNASIDYAMPLTAGALDLSANAYYNDGFAFTVDNSFNQPAYVNLAASATWTAPNERFRATLYGKNLTNKRVATMLSENTGNGNVAALWAAPRTYGVTVGYKF